MLFVFFIAFGILGNGFQQLTLTTLFRASLALPSRAIPFTLEMKALGQFTARTLVY
jgi:inner membrane transporter RhtA